MGARSVLKIWDPIFYSTDRTREVNKLFIIWVNDPLFEKKTFSSVTSLLMTNPLGLMFPVIHFIFDGNSIIFVRFSLFSETRLKIC